LRENRETGKLRLTERLTRNIRKKMTPPVLFKPEAMPVGPVAETTAHSLTRLNTKQYKKVTYIDEEGVEHSLFSSKPPSTPLSPGTKAIVERSLPKDDSSKTS
jgi:hypothetical protein